MEDRPRIGIELDATDKPEVSLPLPASGWGEDGHSIFVKGQIANIKITKDGEAQFGITIQKDGTICLTDYCGMGFRLFVPQNMTLTPAHPWSQT